MSSSILRLISYAGWLGLLAVQLGMIGCSVNEDGFETHGTTARQTELIQQAADAWCIATDGRNCPSVGAGDSDIWTTPENGAYYGLRRSCPDGRSDIYLVENLEDSHFYSVAVHEFGHHFGCPDYGEDYDGIMAIPTPIFEPGDPAVISAGDLACLR